MKLFWILLAVGGEASYYAYTTTPIIDLKLVDWENQIVTVVVRGDEIKINAGMIFRTQSALLAPIYFNKFELTAKKSQTNIGAPNVLMVSITEGDTIIGQPIYIDFDSRTIEGQSSKGRK